MEKLTAKILVGDNRETLKSLPTGSVQTVITSPPYWGLRDYGQDDQIGLESTPQEFVEQLCLVFDEVWRVLANDGTLWLNLGDSYSGSGGAGNQFNQLEKGLAKYKQSGKPKEIGLKPKDMIGIPWRVAFALQDRGWYLRQDIIWAKPNPMPEPVKDRCTKSHEYMFLLTKEPRYYFDHEAIKEPVSYELTGKAQIRSGGNKYGDSNDSKHATKSGNIYEGQETRNKRDVWNISPSRYADAHFATYPPELVLPCVLAGSKEGDIVLDPFSGSGTTGEVALKNNRNYIGLELNPEYAQLSEKRINEAIGMFGEVIIENSITGIE